MVAGYILTGGKNRRMDGQKKIFLSYKEETFLTCILKAFGQLDQIYLSVDEIYHYESVDLPLICDLYPAIGPMGGVYSGLMKCREDALFVTACDTPLIDQKSVQLVLEAYEANKRPTIVKQNGWVHPLFGIYTKEVLPLMEEMIASGQYKMMGVFDKLEYNLVELNPASQVLTNINTKQEYQMLG